MQSTIQLEAKSMTHSINPTAVAIPSLSAGSKDRQRWLLALLPALILAASASPAAAGCCEGSVGATEAHLSILEGIKRDQESPEYQQVLQQKAAINAKIKALGGGFQALKQLTEAEQQFYKQHVLFKAISAIK
jgi:hypothetical protein